MIICKSCGWEINSSDFWAENICDDCALDSVIQHNKEQRIIV